MILSRACTAHAAKNRRPWCGASAPKKKSQMPHAMPAHRDAQRVRAITPLFCRAHSRGNQHGRLSNLISALKQRDHSNASANPLFMLDRGHMHIALHTVHQQVACCLLTAGRSRLPARRWWMVASVQWRPGNYCTLQADSNEGRQGQQEPPIPDRDVTCKGQLRGIGDCCTSAGLVLGCSV